MSFCHLVKWATFCWFCTLKRIFFLNIDRGTKDHCFEFLCQHFAQTSTTHYKHSNAKLCPNYFLVWRQNMTVCCGEAVAKLPASPSSTSSATASTILRNNTERVSKWVGDKERQWSNLDLDFLCHKYKLMYERNENLPQKELLFFQEQGTVSFCPGEEGQRVCWGLQGQDATFWKIIFNDLATFSVEQDWEPSC